MAARKLSAMTPEDRAAKVAALSPAWAREYIGQLEDLTRALHAQLTEARRQGAEDLNLAREISGARDRLVTSDQTPARAECTLHQPLPVAGCAACETMSLAEWQDRYTRHSGQQADTQLAGPDGSVISTSVWTGAGITPPDGEYATARVLDGRANMEPLADLPEGAEIRFADFYQVHYGSSEGTGDARVLVVETDQPMIMQPMAPYRIIITRAG